MLAFENHLGKVTITEQYLETLVRGTVESCFGVAGIAEEKRPKLFDGGKAVFPTAKSISIRCKEDALWVELHIIALYGTNVSAVVKNVMHKVTYMIEEHVELPVAKVNVFIDGMKQ